MTPFFPLILLASFLFCAIDNITFKPSSVPAPTLSSHSQNAYNQTSWLNPSPIPGARPLVHDAARTSKTHQSFCVLSTITGVRIMPVPQALLPQTSPTTRPTTTTCGICVRPSFPTVNTWCPRPGSALQVRLPSADLVSAILPHRPRQTSAGVCWTNSSRPPLMLLPPSTPPSSTRPFPTSNSSSPLSSSSDTPPSVPTSYHSVRSLYDGLTADLGKYTYLMQQYADLPSVSGYVTSRVEHVRGVLGDGKLLRFLTAERDIRSFGFSNEELTEELLEVNLRECLAWYASWNS